MSENTERDPLAEVVAFEAAAFRVGQAARQLLAEHPDLPVMVMEPTAWVLRVLDGPDVTAHLEIQADSVDGVHAWAAALDVEATVKVSTKSPYETAHAEAVIDQVMVKVTGGRSLIGDEAAAWRAEQDQAAADESESPSGGAE